MKKRVYIAGPITKGPLDHNINQATAAFVALAKAGLAPHCPHWSCYSGNARWETLTTDDGGQYEAVIAEAGVTPNELTHADWYGLDLAWVAVADAVLRLPGESRGADLETAEAAARGIPVFHSVEDVTAWARAAAAA